MENSKYKILIVDDDDGVREIIYRFLAPKGYQLFSAENGEVALEIFRQESPHIILLDLRMPLMDGHEFMAAVNPAPDSPFLVVVLTGHDTEEEITHCFEQGCCAFMKKPPDYQEVNRIVEGCLKLKFAEQGDSGFNEEL